MMLVALCFAAILFLILTYSKCWQVIRNPLPATSGDVALTLEAGSSHVFEVSAHPSAVNITAGFQGFLQCPLAGMRT